MAEKKLSPAERFKEMLDALKEQDSFYVDGAKVELSEQIYVAMEEKGISEAELSRRLGVSRAYVNKILQGSANLTIESLVKIGRALGREFRFEFSEPKITSRCVGSERLCESSSTLRKREIEKDCQGKSPGMTSLISTEDHRRTIRKSSARHSRRSRLRL